VHTEIPALRLARRIEQFAKVAADANWQPYEFVVIGGDFNTVTQRGVRALVDTMHVAGLERVSSPTAPSYRRGGRDLSLDHVFASGFADASGGVVTGTTASDHAPLWIELDFPDAS
jgi:endonuclease/exonuclease/phosphatase family metal-dependent hydrolase